MNNNNQVTVTLPNASSFQPGRTITIINESAHPLSVYGTGGSNLFITGVSESVITMDGGFSPACGSGGAGGSCVPAPLQPSWVGIDWAEPTSFASLCGLRLFQAPSLP